MLGRSREVLGVTQRQKSAFSTSGAVMCFFLVVALSSAFGCAEEPLLVPVGGMPLATRLQSIDGDRLAFTDANDERLELRGQDLVRWGSLVNPHAVDQVLLSDGSILIGHLTKIRRDAFVLETELWGELTLPRSKAVAVIWALPTDPVEQWKVRDRLAAGSGKEQTLTLRNGDTLAGHLIEGDVHVLKVMTDRGPIDVKQELVASWHRSFDQMLNPFKQQIVLGLTDGSQLVTTELSVDQQLQAKLSCGVLLVTVPGVRPIDEALVCYLRPKSKPEHLQYLSELTPLGYKHVPFLNDDWEWAADRNVLKGPLSSSFGAYYAKGVGMHSTSRLAFELGEAYDEFQAEVCLDATSGDGGSVVFRVFLLGVTGKWQEAFKSPVVRGADAPFPVRVPLRGANRIALVIDFADRGDVLDRGNWLGARVVKK